MPYGDRQNKYADLFSWENFKIQFPAACQLEIWSTRSILGFKIWAAKPKFGFDSLTRFWKQRRESERRVHRLRWFVFPRVGYITKSWLDNRCSLRGITAHRNRNITCLVWLWQAFWSWFSGALPNGLLWKIVNQNTLQFGCSMGYRRGRPRACRNFRRTNGTLRNKGRLWQTNLSNTSYKWCRLRNPERKTNWVHQWGLGRRSCSIHCAFVGCQQ